MYRCLAVSLQTTSNGVNRAAISARRGSRNGGNVSCSPSIGPSTSKRWPVGGQLEEDMVGLADIHRPKVVPVDDAAVAVAQLVQPLGPVADLLPDRHAQRHMMHAARAIVGARQVVAHDHMHLGVRPAVANRVDVCLGLWRIRQGE